MTADKTQEEGNRLIAEFDGWQSNKYHNLPNKLHKMEAGEEVGIAISQLEYHLSWDALMPVVEKIKKKYSFQMAFSKNLSIVSVYDYDAEYQICQERGASPIETTRDCIVKFIQWYKLNSK